MLNLLDLLFVYAVESTEPCGKLSHSDDYHSKTQTRDHEWTLILVPRTRFGVFEKLDVYLHLTG